MLLHRNSLIAYRDNRQDREKGRLTDRGTFDAVVHAWNVLSWLRPAGRSGHASGQGFLRATNVIVSHTASLSAVWSGRASRITRIGLTRTFSGNESPCHKRKVPCNCLTLQRAEHPL
jgi:hypothetical protein